ncbi:hypothetical protein C8F04DRAFT_1392709 [Mycena alexandri]|uniref:Uncharacterized protein n=1 Tax=Mycena alexandri TaxID=1745969 RepID=A0AAD6T3N5_9AGAR|nr:hypothetical protein C8F04DRAFT_1392709 [Mycena alexandri]
MFPPELVAIGYYNAENANTWIDVDKFMRWMGLQAQKSSATPPTSPVRRCPIPKGPLPSPLPPSSPLLSSPIPAIPLRTSVSTSRGGHSGATSSLIPVPDSDDEFPLVPLLGKQKKSVAHLESHSDHGATKLRKKKKVEKDEDVRVAITKQLRVAEIRDIQTIPSCWTVPCPEIEPNFAYRLDLTADSREWLDSKNEPLSMAAIIKSEDQDSWGGGSAGLLRKPSAVIALDNAPCQAAYHECQGVFVCDQLDETLLDGHERYVPDDDEMRELFQAERTVNTNLDGKNGFIGCQNYSAGQSRTHRFITINRDVKEDLIRELLANNGKFISDVNLDSGSALCARVLPPRSGGKGDRLCPYTHIDENHQVVKGKIIHRPCKATIRIFSPLDRDDRRAIVYLTGPHNHPKFPSSKVSRKGKDVYRQAIDSAGVTGMTVLKLDNASSTSKIFNGQIPAQLDPALANARIKRGLILKAKRVENPHGLGIEGVIFRQKQMQKLPRGKQYIWRVTSELGEEMVITMLPYLANLIHIAKVSLHDNTYARVHGIWKEWEVVIWDHSVDFRVTIGLIYSQHETYEVFKKMWPGLFETIARITDSEVKIKFIDGEGLQAILVDGNKPQANTLGDYLVSRNRPHLSGIHEKDPKLILLECLRTCILHVYRKFTSMAKTVPDEPMARIRRSPYIKTQQELDEFVQWCKDSEYKVVRDWIVDKASVPWFFPSINEFLSHIPEEDWYLTPGDTNLNESAHPYTNQHTGTNLALLEAIDTAYEMDLKVEARHRAMQESCVLVNHRNTKPQRDRNNVARRTASYQQALDRSEAQIELEKLENSIQQTTAATKELRERRKTLKDISGIKKTKRRGERAKETLPSVDEFAGLSDVEEDVNLSPVRLVLRLRTDTDDDMVNLDVQLDTALEPLFPAHTEQTTYFDLPSDLMSYIP